MLRTLSWQPARRHASLVSMKRYLLALLLIGLAVIGFLIGRITAPSAPRVGDKDSRSRRDASVSGWRYKEGGSRCGFLSVEDPSHVFVSLFHS